MVGVAISASVTKRFFALAIDTVLLTVASLMVMDTGDVWVELAMAYGSVLYMILGVSVTGATLGKAICALTVRDSTGRIPSLWKATLREAPSLVFVTSDFICRAVLVENEFRGFWVLAVVIWFGAELVSALSRKDGASIHDIISRTLVVDSANVSRVKFPWSQVPRPGL